MTVADIHATVFSEVFIRFFGTKNKLADFVTSEIVLSSEYPLGGLSEDGGANTCSSHMVHPLLDPENIVLVIIIIIDNENDSGVNNDNDNDIDIENKTMPIPIAIFTTNTIAITRMRKITIPTTIFQDPGAGLSRGRRIYSRDYVR